MTDDLITRLSVGTTEKFRDGSSETVSTALEREAAEALKAKNARIAEIAASREAVWKHAKTLEKDLLAHKERIAELEAALKPFADKSKVFHDYVDDYPIMFGAEPPLRVGDLRAARAALGEKE